jgi:hypothetical protein
MRELLILLFTLSYYPGSVIHRIMNLFGTHSNYLCMGTLEKEMSRHGAESGTAMGTKASILCSLGNLCVNMPKK